MQEAIPAVASDPLQLIPTAWLNQPFESGARAEVAETPVGALVSNLNAKEDAELVLPALSVQVPLNDALAESGVL